MKGVVLVGFKKVLRALRIAFFLPVMAGLAKGGKGGGS
jgi:hypothetical protein